MAEAAKWYVLHTYSAYENTVKATIEKTVENRHLQDQVLSVFIPLETVIETTKIVQTESGEVITGSPKIVVTEHGTAKPGTTKEVTVDGGITRTVVTKVYDRKIYPGYVLVKMFYSDNTWHIIKNVRGVTGFVGTSSNDPIPLTEEEVYAMGVEKKEIIVDYQVGDTVRILDGPLSSFTGTVATIEPEKNAVSVIVSMFGRETSVEFELDQVEVVSQ